MSTLFVQVDRVEDLIHMTGDYFTPPKQKPKQKPKAITNADRLRSMSDEELAWEFARICRMPFYTDDREIDEYEVDLWARWLKEETET